MKHRYSGNIGNSQLYLKIKMQGLLKNKQKGGCIIYKQYLKPNYFAYSTSIQSL